MSELAPRLRTVHHKVSNLLAHGEHWKAERNRLEEALRDAKRNSSVLQARIVELEREVEVLRAERPAIAAGDRPVTKERIDELVNEIDRCLALLTN
jgi:chromosome segregation ATPase